MAQAAKISGLCTEEKRATQTGAPGSCKGCPFYLQLSTSQHMCEEKPSMQKAALYKGHPGLKIFYIPVSHSKKSPEIYFLKRYCLSSGAKSALC